MKKIMNLKSLLFCAMLVITMSFNTVNVQAGALDYLGNIIEGSELTNDVEAFGNYQSVARSTYLHQGFVRITNNGNGYVGIGAGTECNVICNTVKLNVYLERSSGDGNFYSYKKWENVAYNEASLYLDKEVKVEKGYYYRLRGYHSCTKNGVTENGGSSTNGIYIG
ncbi:DUF6147 family protein [Fusicatenibacter sp.]